MPTEKPLSPEFVAECRLSVARDRYWRASDASKKAQDEEDAASLALKKVHLEVTGAELSWEAEHELHYNPRRK